jgi:hypothetical protein
MKIPFSISAECTQNVHNFEQILNFRSGNEGYENVSNCQRVREDIPPGGGRIF